MRFIDICHAIALAALLAWLFIGNLGGSARPGEVRVEDRAAGTVAVNTPERSETVLRPQPIATATSGAVLEPQPFATAMTETVLRPQPIATAKVDERRFWIFVAESPDAWSVAVSEDD